MNANKYLDSKKQDLYKLGDELFNHPELGYKEFTNKKILEDYFKANGLKTKDLGFETAFAVSIGKGKPHIGLIAELDAIPTLGHPFANKNDNNAAHSCGHSTQCAIMASALVALNKQGIKKGKITLFFTPAEEFTDIDYRKKLIKERKIKYIGGKVNMLEAGMFDDVDMFIHCHATNTKDGDFTVGSALAGFAYKRISFLGKAAHAAMAPEAGIDAMDMFVKFYEKIKELKGKYDPKEMVRLHGILVEGGQSVNSIPERVIYEMYVRSINPDILLELNKTVDKEAKKAAKAIGGKAKIETTPGYLPMLPSEPLTKVVESCVKKYTKRIGYNEKSIAAGDVGDISVFKPIIQFGYTGFKGYCHSRDLMIEDYEKVYLIPSKIVVDTINKLLDKEELVKQIKNYKPRMTKKEYREYINAKA